MKDLFIAITDHLKSISSLAWIDDDYGQADSFTSRPPVAFPAALVSIGYTNTQDTGMAEDKEQLVNARISVKLVFMAEGETNTAAPDEVRLPALARYDVAEEVHALLQGWDNDGAMAPLTRTGMENARSAPGFKVMVINYRTDFTEQV